MTPTTYTINGSTYEPLTDYLRGWIPGAMGWECPVGANAEIVQAYHRGSAQRIKHGFRDACVTNTLWHSIREGTCRKVAQ